MRDSAGVRIVENGAAAWSVSTRWTVDTVPALDIGGSTEDPSQQLYRVEDIVGLGDGIAVLNAGSSEILYYSESGALRWRVGGRGGGPSEFMRLSDIYRCGNDTLVVNDFNRVSTFSSAGMLVRTERVVPAPGDEVLRVRGVTHDCSRFALSAGANRNPEPGEAGRRSTTLFWGELAGVARDTIGAVVTQEVVTRVVQEVPQPMLAPWGADGTWAVGQDRLDYGATERPEVRVYGLDGSLNTIVRWPASRRRITGEDRRRYAEKREWLIKQFPSVADVVPPLDECPVPEYMPLFRSMLLDDEGNLWVRTYPSFVAGRPDLYDLDVPLRYSPPPGTIPEVWLVFDPTGRWLGEVSTPPALSVRTVYHGMIIGVRKDELDVEHVEAYHVRKPT